VRKKVVALILSVMLCLLLGGCASSIQLDAKDDLIIYTPHSPSFTDAIVEEFEEKTHIHVNLVKAGTGELVERIRQEGDEPLADILWGGSLSIMMKGQDLWEGYTSVNDKAFYPQYQNTDPFTGKKMAETYDGALYVVQNPPQPPLSSQEMDDIYSIEYCRNYHPMYEKDGGIPAIKEVKFSLISNRGCFGGCNFCALTFHQGRIIQTRSHKSIVNEAKEMIKDPDFKGYIHDVGGPTANFRKPSCTKQLTKGVCTNKQCLFPTPCKNLEFESKDYTTLLRELRELPGVKKVFVRSGIRFDYLLLDEKETLIRDMCKHHISGQLKVAPEHISNNVLKYMGKPNVEIYNKFCARYEKINEQLDKKQYLVPYLMSSHPGSTLDDAIMLAEYLCKHHINPEQVQDFYPTPSTLSTTMYYTGIDPRDMSPVYVATNPHEKAMQRALIQYRKPENYDLVKEALLKANREDLIGFGPECLIPPRKLSPKNNNTKAKNSKTSSNNKKAPKVERNVRPNERNKNRSSNRKSKAR